MIELTDTDREHVVVAVVFRFILDCLLVAYGVSTTV